MYPWQCFCFFFDSCKENEKREAPATLDIFPFSVGSKRKWRSSKRKKLFHEVANAVGRKRNSFAVEIKEPFRDLR